MTTFGFNKDIGVSGIKTNNTISLRQKPSSPRRLVNKNGDFQVSLEEIGCMERLRRYIADCFTTFIEIKWRWTLLFIASGYFLTWIVFATFYYAFGYLNGDMTRDQTSSVQPCVTEVNSFTTALLFSVESQHTIGYGSRAVTEHCPHIITAVFFQFIIGVGVQCLIAGLFFAKLQRAKKRSQTITFSRLACVSKFNDQLCLSLRVGNLRSSLLLNVRAMGILVKKRISPEGNEIPLTQRYIDFYTESLGKRINLFWPAIIYHPLNEASPLCNASQNEILSGYSELIVVLEGVIDSTSKTFQARTSYLPVEIFNGYRFKSISPVLNADNAFQISYMDFNMLIPSDVIAKRNVRLRDSFSQTTERNFTSTPIEYNCLRSWRSLDDVRDPSRDSRDVQISNDLLSIPTILISPAEEFTASVFRENRDTIYPYYSAKEMRCKNDFGTNTPADEKGHEANNGHVIQKEAQVTKNSAIVRRTSGGHKTFEINAVKQT